MAATVAALLLASVAMGRAFHLPFIGKEVPVAPAKHTPEQFLDAHPQLRQADTCLKPEDKPGDVIRITTQELKMVAKKFAKGSADTMGGVVEAAITETVTAKNQPMILFTINPSAGKKQDPNMKKAKGKSYWIQAGLEGDSTSLAMGLYIMCGVVWSCKDKPHQKLCHSKIYLVLSANPDGQDNNVAKPTATIKTNLQKSGSCDGIALNNNFAVGFKKGDAKTCAGDSAFEAKETAWLKDQVKKIDPSPCHYYTLLTSDKSRILMPYAANDTKNGKPGYIKKMRTFIGPKKKRMLKDIEFGPYSKTWRKEGGTAMDWASVEFPKRYSLTVTTKKDNTYEYIKGIGEHMLRLLGKSGKRPRPSNKAGRRQRFDELKRRKMNDPPTFAEIMEYMDNLANEYAGAKKFTKRTLPKKTFLNQAMEGAEAKLFATENPRNPQKKKHHGIIVLSGFRGDFRSSLLTGMGLLLQVLENNFKGNLKEDVIHYFPMVNPDGISLEQRKGIQSDESSCADMDDDGIDINANFVSKGFKQVADKCAADYGGTAAGNTPEVQNIISFTEDAIASETAETKVVLILEDGCDKDKLYTTSGSSAALKTFTDNFKKGFTTTVKDSESKDVTYDLTVENEPARGSSALQFYAEKYPKLSSVSLCLAEDTKGAGDGVSRGAAITNALEEARKIYGASFYW